MLELFIVNKQIAIAGKVLQGETKKPIAGAIVEIIEMPEKFRNLLALKALSSGEQWQKLSQRPDRTITRNDGYFYLTNLPPGDYVIKTSIPTRIRQDNSVQTTVKVAEPVSAKVNHQNISIIPTTITEIVLSPTGIKGKINDAN